MISSLRGRIAAKGDNYVVLDVGGVGFKVFAPSSALERSGAVGQEISLFTHLHVRENELALYGFGSPDELQLFELLLGVSGIGPKVGLKLVSILSVETLREAIASGDAATLTRIPGIGKKIAERVMMDLKDKLGVNLEFVSYPALTHADAEVISALTSLGYSVSEAQAAQRSLPQGGFQLEDKVRLAQQYFARE